MRQILALISAALCTFAFAAETYNPPEPRSEKDVQTLLEKAPKPVDAGKPLNIVLVHGKKDHGKFEHDYPLWRKRWFVYLTGKPEKADDPTQINLYDPPAKTDEKYSGAANISVKTAYEWPTKEQFESANLVVLFFMQSWPDERIKDLDNYLNRGGGLVCLHSSVIPGGGQQPEPLAQQLGLAWKWGVTTFRHGDVDLKITAKDNPIMAGLPEKIFLVDETYWPFVGDFDKVKILATSDEIVKKGFPKKEPYPVIWTYEKGRGRVFCNIMGHFVWSFDDPYFRLMTLRGMAWAAGENVNRFDSLVPVGARMQTK